MNVVILVIVNPDVDAPDQFDPDPDHDPELSFDPDPDHVSGSILLL